MHDDHHAIDEPHYTAGHRHSSPSAMRYPANETAQKRERILDEAARLFRERGFDRVGVAEVMQAAGLTHGAFYAHFASKEALASEALARAFARSEKRLFRKRHADEDLKQRFVERYLNRAHLNDPGDGCPLVSLGAEVARSDALQDGFTEALEQMIEKMAESFDWTPSDDASGAPARARSIMLLSTAVGALTLARAVNNPQLANEVLNTVKTELLAQPD